MRKASNVAAPVCVPKTSSPLIDCQNHVTFLDHVRSVLLRKEFANRDNSYCVSMAAFESDKIGKLFAKQHISLIPRERQKSS